MGHAQVTLLNGQIVEVEGDIGEVEKLLSDAARSGHARFAWLTECGSGERVGVNPDQVLTLRGGEQAAEAKRPGRAGTGRSGRCRAAG